MRSVEEWNDFVLRSVEECVLALSAQAQGHVWGLAEHRRVEPTHCPTGATSGEISSEQKLIWGFRTCHLRDWGFRTRLRAASSIYPKPISRASLLVVGLPDNFLTVEAEGQRCP
jgi:hypothetical protein